MKFAGILLLLAALVAIEASPQARATIPCKVDGDCPKDYGCNCDDFTKLCVNCKQCTSDKGCRDMYSNADTGCQCSYGLCIDCLKSP